MNDVKKVQELEEEIWDLKIRIKRIEEYIQALPNPDHYLSNRKGSEAGSNDDILDVLFLIQRFDTISTAFLQRKMGIGYLRAARIIDRLEEIGILSPAKHNNTREVLHLNLKAYLESQ